VLIGAAVLAGVLSVYAQDSAQEVLDHVRRKYDSVTDAEVKFSQTAKFSMSKVEQSVSGILFMKKGNKYRVESGEQTIVTDGVNVWSYSSATRQVVIDKFKPDSRGITPERILTGSPAGFVPAVVGHDKLGKFQAVQLKLTPRDDQSLLSSIRLWVDDKDWLVRQAELVDVNGKTTTYVVQQIRVNAGIPDERFTFQAPEGTETVDLR
jgi:chaperone LolA